MKFVLPALTLASLFVLTLSLPSAEAKIYEHELYTVEYPSGCKLEKGGKYETKAFNIECKGDSGIQIESGSIFGEYFTGTAQEDIGDIEYVMKRTWDSETVESGVDKYTINNVPAPYVLATYEQEFTNFLGLPAESEDWVIMAVLVDIGNNQSVMAEYYNDAKNFDKQLPMAEKIFQSIKGTGVIAEPYEADTSTGTGDLSTLCDSMDTVSLQRTCERILGDQ